MNQDRLAAFRELLDHQKKTLNDLEYLYKCELKDSGVVLDVDFGQKVADHFEEKFKGDFKPNGTCLKAVQDGLEELGIYFTRVNSAFLAPPQLEKSESFINRYNKLDTSLFTSFNTLPPGTIIVFNKTLKHRHGHIEVKGNGKHWISDYIQLERKSYAGKIKPDWIYLPISKWCK